MLILSLQLKQPQACHLIMDGITAQSEQLVILKTNKRGKKGSSPLPSHLLSPEMTPGGHILTHIKQHATKQARKLQKDRLGLPYQATNLLRGADQPCKCLLSLAICKELQSFPERTIYNTSEGFHLRTSVQAFH